ncbi:N-6 DNA methylase [Rhodopirellula baltica]|uniref:site-specific DNA-methyltransferase (adenine-specific) n=1 Tax=Rhodopirellula baltica (strain DSM 10527 / NCIMB 13988 / SH1) TaxID=243090 RepID=Q7TTY5_RHOBA|nr:N-6 DNA methylase [Rhodopirellula baltica]CAD79106.1 probable Type I restriction enzyme EcoEI M protein-Escherichia coli [Rhodopirellula baltica SH 1]
MLQLNAALKALIAKLWDRFWSGGISNPLSAIEQITYLLFMKQIDELDLKREQDAEFTGDTYESRFCGDYFLPSDRSRIEEMEKPKPGESAAQKKTRKAEAKNERKRLAIDKATLRWSHFRQMPANEMLPHVQQKVFPFIKELDGDGSNFTKHMANAVFIIPSANLLQGAVQIIEEIFVEIERDAREEGHLFQDIQGDVYEMLLNEISSAGKNGQFRTPRHIIKLISELVNPQLGHRVCDPACGTAGFLLDAYQYIITQLARKKAKKNQEFEPDEDGFIRTSVSGQLDQNKKDILEQSLYGFDFDSTMVRLALMNLMMHGIDNPHVDYQDTLSKSFSEEAEYDIVMAQSAHI